MEKVIDTFANLDIKIIEKTLSDGSFVYNIKYGNLHETLPNCDKIGKITIPCVDKKNAYEFADKFIELLNMHTIV